jgi:hypothetical protein
MMKEISLLGWCCKARHVPAISTDVSTAYVTISLLRHRLTIESLVISLHFCGKHCQKVPDLPLSFLISLELTVDISHWGWAGL